MIIIAYIYSNPLLEIAPDPYLWGWEIDRVYQDLGDRIQLQHLFSDCTTEPANYLLIRRVDELGDDVEQVAECLQKLEVLGVTIIPVEQPYNEEQTIRANLLKLVQEIHRNQRSRNIKKAHAKNRLKFAPPPGQAPFGYKRGQDKYLIDKKTLPIVKEFFNQFLLFASLRGAVRSIEKKYNKKISVTTGKRWLINPVYRGDTAYINGEIISNTHPAIISREEAAQIDRILRRNKSLPRRSASASRSLAGLVFCGVCDCAMTITRVTRRKITQEYLYLRPINCVNNPKCKAIAYDDILTQSIDKISVDLPLAVTGVNQPDLKGFKERILGAIAQKEQILQQLPSLLNDGILDEETAELRTYKLRTEMAKLQAQIDQLPPENLLSIAQAVSIPSFWFGLSETERRFYFREFLSKIEIFKVDDKIEIKLIFIFDR
jgi:DNA invertase Pin-like site-specific DNA recombinase/predicted metal-binding protein